MFACIYVPDFLVEAILRSDPELREQAVAIVEGRPPLLNVVAVNERARAAAVEIGMTQVQAQGRLPGLYLRKRSALQENAAHASLLDCAAAISPRIHDEASDAILLDLTGLERLFGAPTKIARELTRRVGELGMEVNVGVAANVETAIHAARGFSGTTVIPRGKEAERLAPLSVEILFRTGAQRTAEENDMLDTLERWGVRTFRALALLPEIALAERLGEQGTYLRKLARGEGSRPLVPGETPLVFEEAVELEDAIDLLEPLAFVLNRMLEQLCTRLATRSLAAHELHLRLQLDPQEDVQLWSSVISDELSVKAERSAVTHNSHRGNPPRRHKSTERIRPSEQIGAGFKSEISNQNSEIESAGTVKTANAAHFSEYTLKFPVPMLDCKVFLKLLQLELRARQPQAPVTKLWLRAEPAHPRSTQGGLFLPTAPEPERLEVTLARIGGVLRGKTNLPRSHGSTQKVRSVDHRSIDSSQISKDLKSEFKIQNSEIQATDSPHTMRVGSAVVLDTHCPDAFRMKRFAPQQHATYGRHSVKPETFRRGSARTKVGFKSEIRIQNSEIEPSVSPCLPGGSLAFRRFRPPLYAHVQVEGERPARLDGGEGHCGEIIWAAGPWRASGEWWNEQQWSRDAWDVAIAGESVTVYRIYCEREQWFLEGLYD